MNDKGFFARKWKLIGGVVLIVLVALLADFFVGLHQKSVLRSREEMIRHLEAQASRMVSVDIRDITETPDIGKTGAYTAVIRIDNVGDEPVYLSHPSAKVYIQTGTISWSEIPVGDVKGEPQRQVYKLEQGTLLIRKTLTVPRGLPYNRHLIPLYMHLRFYVTMDVLPESGFKEGEVVDRKSDIYVYLKPYWVSKGEVARAIDFGDTKVPTYMPISAFRNWNTAQ